jgi:hypothetical protein
MIDVEEVNIESVAAYKVFSIDQETEKLQSVFFRSWSPGFYYEPNKEIEVSPTHKTFFAFKNYNDAIRIAETYKRWNLVNYNLLVLPVELKDVRFVGHFHVRSDDIQSTDSFFPSYESKKIIVHDSEENRKEFYKTIFHRWVSKQDPGLVHRRAIKYLLPELKGYV